MTATDLDRHLFEREWEQWHAEHEKALADPHGFLAITSLHWLSAEPARFDDAPGAWSTGQGGVRVVLAEDEELRVDGEAVHGEHCFGVIPERSSVHASFGDAVVEVAKRCGHDIVRPRHPDHTLVANFLGTPTYPPDARWAVSGRFVPFDPPRQVTVDAAVEGLLHVYESPGQIEVALEGTIHRLTAFNGKQPGQLMVLFTDATSGVTTTAACRVLHLEGADAEGRLTVDFNRATNLPCAYTEFATCPLAPAENRLSVAVEAGEKIPFEHR
jgi:uncharacterized protein (DUF1684 family)